MTHALRIERTGGRSFQAPSVAPFHVGRSTQVWEVRIVDEQQRPICVSRCTLAVVAKDRPNQ